jgi:hypothetical protein
LKVHPVVSVVSAAKVTVWSAVRVCEKMPLMGPAPLFQFATVL